MEAIIFTIIFISSIAAIIVLYFYYWIAKQFYEAACMKGYDEKKYLWICFFFGIAGYLLVCALPVKNDMNNAQPTVKKTVPLDGDGADDSEQEEQYAVPAIDSEQVKRDRRNGIIVVALIVVLFLAIVISGITT